MNVEKYQLKSSKDFLSFEFTSIGKNGIIKKIIQFQETNEANLFNLAFGDKIDDTFEIDDLAISNNGDTNKILATVSYAVLAFLEMYPNAFVYATGSTIQRTRLYRMGISKFYLEIEKHLIIYGQIENEFIIFELEKNYQGFLVQRKNH